MNHLPQRPLEAARRFIARSQQASGSWPGVASYEATPFGGNHRRPTVFFTALIAGSLSVVPETEMSRQKACQYLLRHASSSLTWNYWERNSSMRLTEPYPDDLDDTACALAACSQSSPHGLSGRQQAQLAQALITAEQQPGGPYATWLIDEAELTTWHDIDVAVNANIAFVLQLQQTRLTSLDHYLETAITQAEVNSSYYYGQEPVIYFLARSCPPNSRITLQQMVTSRLISYTSLSALRLALLIASANRLGIADTSLQSARLRLLSLQQADGSWPAEAFYMEPPKGGRQRYAGSRALTTAFCLEALSFTIPPQAPAKKSDFNNLVRMPCAKRSPLKQSHDDHLRKLVHADHDGQIMRYSQQVGLALKTALTEQQIRLLNSGSTYGWLAYTILDNAIDDQQVLNLPLAFGAQRHMMTCFLQLGLGDDFTILLHKTLQAIDEANMWELTKSRALPGKPIAIRSLPDYADLSMLADRSLGHLLVPAAVGLIGTRQLGSFSQSALESFYRHYLIARQLNDDAHDWEQDLLHGQLTAVVCLLLRAFAVAQNISKVDPIRDIDALRQYFWNNCLATVNGLISGHTQAARQTLRTKLSVEDNSCFDQWLDRLEEATRIALIERDKAVEFTATFNDC